MKSLYLVSYRLEEHHYMKTRSETSEPKVRAVWADSEQSARDMLTADIEGQSKPYDVSYYVDIIDAEIAMGSPFAD